jgi:hypothetical protein
MCMTIDGPVSPHFYSMVYQNQITPEALEASNLISQEMRDAVKHAPLGSCVCWGIPFQVNGFIQLADQPVKLHFPGVKARWLVFMHTSDIRPMPRDRFGLVVPPMRGEGQLNEHAADYVFLFDDSTEVRCEIRRRHQVGAFTRRWGDNCFQAVEASKPKPMRAAHEQLCEPWGDSQTRNQGWEYGPWVNWLWAWENPYPEKTLVGLRIEPVTGVLIISGLSFSNVIEQPLRWRRRQKALLTLPEGDAFNPLLDKEGRLAQIQLDLGQVISGRHRQIYPDQEWQDSYNNQLPEHSDREVIIEYTSHPEACFHLPGQKLLPVSKVEASEIHHLKPLPPSNERVLLQVIDKYTRRPVAVKLHIHGAAGEYLAPLDRHRIINPAWFQDFSVDFTHRWNHSCTYINGEALLDLPLGPVFIEVSKGFEIRPLRKQINVVAGMETMIIEVEKVLPWREGGWVTADTHVHFLSPVSALLEGSAEGVNIINLLASQWGELMTNVGDFDGQTTWGSPGAGGEGEYLVRVGTENRQHILGHISLLGYRGRILAPMTTGGPDESALGDPVECLLTEWAQRCRANGGLVVLPHFPNPRAEYAASIISGEVDALEMTAWGDLYSGIDPYSLSDWYRFLNCGHLVAAVGGTDKMSADTAVGTVRTYAHIAHDQPFSYESWMQAVRRAETFVTYGPLLDFSVDGKPMGSRIELPTYGGTVDVTWQVASVTVPVTCVELVVNGEIRESLESPPEGSAGSWQLKVTKSSWFALLVRGRYPDKPEMIAAHSSPVFLMVDGSPLLSNLDAVTILEQIEGALAYIDTIGTRADEKAYKRMRLALISAHRGLHNRLHQAGHFHDHPTL